MKYNILLNKSEDTKAVEAQEQSRFVKSILEALEVPIEFDPDEPLSIVKKQKLRQDLKEFNINILDDMTGGLKIFIGNDLIAEWYKTTYKLKQDLSQMDKQDRLYLQAEVFFWSIFEEEGFKEETEGEM